VNAVPGLTDEPSKQQIATRRINSVLVADDDPLFRRLLESWLRKWDYHVTTAADRLTAWKALENEDAAQLLVLDWIMPMINGVELCQRIRSRKQLRYPYILLLTARDDKQDLGNALESGADDYLTKPFNI
jgi:DNA-binding response OmpR family regulator